MTISIYAQLEELMVKDADLAKRQNRTIRIETRRKMLAKRDRLLPRMNRLERLLSSGCE